MALYPFVRRTRKLGKHCWDMCRPPCADCCAALRDRATTQARRSYSRGAP